ncbi:MAG: acetyl-CoA carboxylase biotin carboxyl carrier protein [Rhizomicrobium sp.]|jgi:acetyl-CoA carboxylase biotin carboxyl carrier protein
MNIRTVKQLGARIANGGKSKTTLTVDATAIRELAELLAETGLSEIEVEVGGQRIRVARHSSHATSDAAYLPVMSERMQAEAGRGDAATPKREAVSGTPVPSPMVGTVYVSPEPGKPAFVKVGDAVKEGDTLLIVEAMKTMNPILAPKAGTVREICIADSQPVEFGQTLLILS